MLLKVVDIVGKSVDTSLESLESNKELSLGLCALLIVVLVPNLVLLVKLVDLVVKVGAWEDLAILVAVVRSVVAGMAVVVVTLRVLLLVDVAAGGGDSFGAHLGLGLELDSVGVSTNNGDKGN